MTVNVMQLMHIKDRVGGFKKRHPGFTGFLRELRKDGVPEGSVLDVRVTFPDGKVLSTNFRVTPEDLELLHTLSELSG